FLLVRRIGVTRLPGLMHHAGAELPANRDFIRIGARRIRSARDLDVAWRTTVEVLSGLGCEEIQLTWTEPVDQMGEHREQVLMWRRRDRGDWQLRDPMIAEDRRGFLDLREDDQQFGQLCVIRPNHGDRSLGAEVALELTRDALIDFCVARTDRDTGAAAKIVSLPQEQPAELRSV
ncbi:MAG: hypothetical protein AAFV29_08475, partial [Myxococcota bacterium]